MSKMCFRLTHWGRVTHICVTKLIIIGSDNGLSPGRRQAIIGTNTGILLIGPLVTKFSENLIKIQTFSFKKMHLKMSSAKWRPFCLGLNVLSHMLQLNHLHLPQFPTDQYHTQTSTAWKQNQEIEILGDIFLHNKVCFYLLSCTECQKGPVKIWRVLHNPVWNSMIRFII